MGGLFAGVDGCPGGWLVALWRKGSAGGIETGLCTTFREVLDLEPQPDLIAVDMPIGLPDVAIKGGRLCDNETRSRLGARQSSVFSVPSRASVVETDYAQACAVNLRHSDPPRRVSKQCFNLFVKMREVDACVTRELQARVREVHPELAFWALNGGAPLDLPKKVKSAPSAPGLELRRLLLERAGFSRDITQASKWPRRLVGPDDIIDACALAWSAERLWRGEGLILPSDPPTDGRGLRMEICA